MNEPFCVTDQIFLVWAEPDEYDHNYQFYSLRKTGCGKKRIEIPKRIVERIKKHASKTHPILIIHGDHLEKLLDRMTWCEKVEGVVPHKKTFGKYPRDREGTPEGDSITEFVEAVKRGERF